MRVTADVDGQEERPEYWQPECRYVFVIAVPRADGSRLALSSKHGRIHSGWLPIPSSWFVPDWPATSFGWLDHQLVLHLFDPGHGTGE